jgi:methylated-DNA-[protein]-cysteine S-methyltransferase
MGEHLYSTELDSPTGLLTLVAHDAALVAVWWDLGEGLPTALRDAMREDSHPVLVETARQLREYFAGDRKAFDLPLDPHGTEFQKKVWLALREIPFGQTRSYGEIARRIGMPSASRAVGAANGKNPIPIIVPCHRVIGANGTLTGFGGGLENKALLLALEGVKVPGREEQPVLAFEPTQ